MRNRDFLKRYVDGEQTQRAHGMMSYTSDGRLFSYDTVICLLPWL